MLDPGIRAAATSDLGEIRALFDQLGYDCPLEMLAAQFRVSSDSASSCVLVSVDSTDRLSGAVSGHVIPLFHRAGSIGRVTALVVDASCRSNGIGAALLAAMESWFVARDCTRVEVTSGDHRKGAHRFYEAQGYAHCGLRLVKPCHDT